MTDNKYDDLPVLSISIAGIVAAGLAGLYLFAIASAGFVNWHHYNFYIVLLVIGSSLLINVILIRIRRRLHRHQKILLALISVVFSLAILTPFFYAASGS